jgi:hypothetical protein
MQFVSSEFGQSLQLVSMDEMRPERGGFFFPDVMKEIIARYRFQAFPERFAANQIMKFEHGTIEAEGVNVLITSLEIYSDGLAISSRHTADADAVLTDFFQWSIEEFRLREPRTMVPRRYQSRLVVDMAESAGSLFIKTFNDINRIISRRFQAEVPLGLADLTIGPSPPTQYPFLHTWVLQPRIVQPLVANRYFSAAPLPTDDHFAMLQEIESAMAA